jgi:hypothetical protein
MALPIRDGNQSLTTLSTLIISNSHVPAHTVVSFGTQGITDIATAVSGVELGPNTLNALENITVTLGQVTITGGLTDTQLRASAVTIGGTVTVGSIVTHGVTIANSSVTIGGSVTATISGTPSVTFTQAPVTFGTAVITGSTSIIGTPSVTFTQASVTFTTATITGSTSILNFPATQPVSIASVTIGNSITISSLPAISGTVTIGSALPAGTNRIGVVTIGSGTVTIGAGTAQIGSVTAGLTGWELLGQRDFFADGSIWQFNSSTIGLYSSLGITFGDSLSGSIQAVYTPAGGQDNDIYWSSLDGTRTRIISSGSGLLTTTAIPSALSISTFLAPSSSQTASLYGKKENVLPLTNTQLRSSAIAISGSITIGSALPTGTNRIGVVTIGAGTVTIGAGTAQIGSVTASISGNVTVFPIQGTSVTTSNFTSTTPSTTIASASAGREILTVFNEGAGNLHICAGATCTTIGYQVRLSTGDYWECPQSQVQLAHAAVFASNGTARVTQIS